MCPFHQESVPTTCCWPMAASGSISRASRGRIASSRANDRSKYARYIWRWSRPLSNNKEESGGGPCAGLRMMPTSKPQMPCSLKHLASSASRKAPLSRTSAWLYCSCPALALQPGAIYVYPFSALHAFNQSHGVVQHQSNGTLRWIITMAAHYPSSTRSYRLFSDQAVGDDFCTVVLLVKLSEYSMLEVRFIDMRDVDLEPRVSARCPGLCCAQSILARCF